jgi:hypothetical protein
MQCGRMLSYVRPHMMLSSSKAGPDPPIAALSDAVKSLVAFSKRPKWIGQKQQRRFTARQLAEEFLYAKKVVGGVRERAKGVRERAP